MTTTWDFENKVVNTGISKLDFTKFAPGVTHIRVIDDAPHVRWAHWQPKHNRSVHCPGRGCPICEIRNVQKAQGQPVTQPMSRRIAIQIINRDSRGRLEICEMGPTWFHDLRDLMEDLASQGKSLLDLDIRVRRRGMGKDDTLYRLDIGDEYPLTEADKQLMEQKTNLDDYLAPHTPAQILRILKGEDWLTVMSNSGDNSRL